MAFTLIQAGTKLYPVNANGFIGPALTLPTGITLDPNAVVDAVNGVPTPGAKPPTSDTIVINKPRFARFKAFIVVVNSPSRPLSVDASGIVRPLTPLTPVSAVSLTATGAGVLSGTYFAEATYVIKDGAGNDITESDYGPLMGTGTATATQQLVATWPLSTETLVDTTRLYRTTSNGSTYFPWLDAPFGVITEQSNTADAALGLIAKPARGSAPDLTLICEWGGRLWGVDRVAVDNLRYTEAGTMYAWSGLNTLPIPHLGADRYGITALAARQNALAVGRRTNIMSVIGSTTADIRPIAVSETLGMLSQESTVTYRDTVFFLWEDGVYTWNDAGITCISDAGKVRSWFTTDSYFNRDMFAKAFAILDPVTLTYRLFLCSAGSTQINAWVDYNLRSGKWYGPHKTDAFTPTCALMVRGNRDMPLPMVGSLEGFLSQDVLTRSDWSVTPIAEDVLMAAHMCGDPEVEKYFGEVSVHTQQEVRGTLKIETIVGDLNATTIVPMTHDLTKPRERLERIGEGKFASLRFKNAEINQNCVIYGYTLPFHIAGTR